MNKEFVVLNLEPYIPLLEDTAWSPYAFYYNHDNNTNEPFIFLCMRKNIESMGIECVVKHFDLIDKYKPWFINIVTNNRVVSDNETVFDCFPPEWISHLRDGKAYLIINNENELNTFSLCHNVYNELGKKKLIPHNKVFVLSAAALIHQVHKEFCLTNHIKNPVKMLYSPHQNVAFYDSDVQFVDNNFQNIQKTKKFNILNREMRLHRPFFVSLLAEKGLLEKGHISLGARSDTIDHVIKTGGWQQYLRDELLTVKNQFAELKHNTVLDQIYSGIDKIHDKIPMCLDKTEFDTNYVSYGHIPLEHMRSSYFHITSCTYFFKFNEVSPGWHEKEWKPVLVKQPFLMLGRPGMLKLMKRFGFMTFSKWIDESYDEIEDDWFRLQALANETERLSSLTDSEWDNILNEMSNVLEFNQRLLIDDRWKVFFFGSDLKNLISYI